jgi:hypothetical protein
MSTTATVLATMTTILAALHSIFAAVRSVFLAVLAAIIILSTHCQADHAEDHQKTQHYCFLKFHVSPFEIEHGFSNEGG